MTEDELCEIERLSKYREDLVVRGLIKTIRDMREMVEDKVSELREQIEENIRQMGEIKIEIPKKSSVLKSEPKFNSKSKSAKSVNKKKVKK